MRVSKSASLLVVALWTSLVVTAEVCVTLTGTSSANSAFCSSQLKSCEQTCKSTPKTNECALKSSTSACYTCDCDTTPDTSKSPATSAAQQTTSPAAQTSKKEDPVKTTETPPAPAAAETTPTPQAQQSTTTSTTSTAPAAAATNNTAKQSSQTQSASTSASAAGAGVTSRPATANTRAPGASGSTSTDRYRIVRTESVRPLPTDQVRSQSQSGAESMRKVGLGGWIAGAVVMVVVGF